MRIVCRMLGQCLASASKGCRDPLQHIYYTKSSIRDTVCYNFVLAVTYPPLSLTLSLISSSRIDPDAGRREGLIFPPYNKVNREHVAVVPILVGHDFSTPIGHMEK